MRKPWLVAGVLVATFFALAEQTSVVTRTGFLAGDFRAFYCAARAVSEHADPYRTQPLGTCERGIGANLFFHKNPGVTIPAPLPAYAIAALVPLAQLPFPAAAAAWIALLLLAWIASVVALTRIAAVEWEVALAALALPLGVISLPFGEVVPLSVACTCIAALAIWKGRTKAAALFAAGAMIEPHLGLPVCLALALWVPATRWLLGLCLGVLVAVALAAVGPAINLEYFSQVLPAHAISELTRDTQYSLSAVLAAAGVAPDVAVKLGGVWYAAMLVVGTLVAGRLAQQTRNPAFIVCVPPAFAVFGGSFIHITQIAIAAPAAVLLASSGERRYRNAGIVALLLLAVPWGWSYSPALVIAPLFPIAFLVWRYWQPQTSTVLLAALGAAALIFGLQHLATLTTPHLGAQPLPHLDPKFPEASWSGFARTGSTGGLAAWALRIPTWAALAILLCALTVRAGFARLRWDRVPALALAAVCTLVPVALQFNADRSSGWLGIDFRAYYCGALAQRERENPYYAESLHSCEASTAAPYYRAPARVTVPAPYPPYVLAFLAPLTFVPFDAAVAIWWSLIVLAIAFAAYALARMSGRELPIGIAALGLSLGLAAFSSGNMVSLGVAALVVAAFCLQLGRPWAGVVAITCAMVEPQIALPAAAAFFLAYPAMRVALAGATALLVTTSLVAGGWQSAIAYVTAVLPAHALAEVSRDNQYSLATILAAVGVPDAMAALLGSLSYLAMLAIGVTIALRLARRYEEPALTLLIPPAFSLLGGTFVHTAEIAAAVPAALLLFTRANAARHSFLIALLLLAVPWMFATSFAIFLAPVFPVAYLAYVLLGRDRTLALTAATLSLAIVAGLFWLAGAPHAQPIAHSHAYPPIDPRLAEASWREFVLGASTNRPVMWLLRLPTWCGLLLLAAPALMLARKPRLLLAEAT